MEFAKYYNATDIVDEMLKTKELDLYPDDQGKYKGVFVCLDSQDFWIARILEGYNEEYEREDGKFLVEREKISIYDVMDNLYDTYGKKRPTFEENEWYGYKKNKVHEYFDKHSVANVIKAVLILDNEEGLSNWDYREEDSLKDCIDIIDGGWGILSVDGSKWNGKLKQGDDCESIYENEGVER